MTKRTPLQRWKEDRLADRIDLRDLAQEVPCSYCQAEIGEPCVYPAGSWRGMPLGRMDHPCRIDEARRQRAARTAATEGDEDG
ncbi:zinc finger domain-containing protein [Actinophytocola sediminis]